MASSQKTIKINPDLFKLNHTAKRRQQPKMRRERPVISVKPNQVKKELLSRIKELQKKEEEIETSKKVPIQKNEKDKDKDNHTEFNDEFNKSLNFLQELSKNKETKAVRRHNKSIRRQEKRENIKHELNIDLPEELRDFNDTVEIY